MSLKNRLEELAIFGGRPAFGEKLHVGRRLALVACIASFVTGLTGTGLLTSVPHSSLLFLLVGWVGARQPRADAAEAASRYVRMEPQPAAHQYG